MKILYIWIIFVVENSFAGGKMRIMLILFFLLFLSESGFSLEAPKIISPKFDDTIANPVEIRWNKVSDAIGYKIEIDRIESTYYIPDKTLITSDTALIISLNEGQKYGLLVWAFLESDTSSNDYTSLTIKCVNLYPPKLLSPSNHSDFVKIYPQFNFYDKCNKRFYFQLAYDSLFTQLEYDIDYLNVPFFNYQMGLKYDTDYFWRVRAFKDTIWSGWSEVFTFRSRSDTVILDKPVLKDPPDGTNNVPICSVKVSWNHVRGATNFIVMYSTDNFKADTHKVKTTLEYATINNLYNDQKYYWKVIATNSEATQSESETWTFTTTKPDSAPVLLYPRDSDTIVPGFIIFSWKESPKYLNREMYLMLVDSLGIEHLMAGTLTNDSSTANSVRSNCTYRWYLWIKGANCEVRLKPNTFYTGNNPYGYPENPELIYPPNNDSLVPPNMKFIWHKGANTTKYWFSLALKSGENSYYNYIYDFIPVIDTFFIPSVKLLPDTSYSWFIQGANSVELNYGKYKINYFKTLASSGVTASDEVNRIDVFYGFEKIIIHSDLIFPSAELYIYDLLGRIVQRERLDLRAGENSVMLNENLPDCFLCVIKTGKHQITKLFMK